MRGPHSGDYVGYRIQGCDAVKSGKSSRFGKMYCLLLQVRRSCARHCLVSNEHETSILSDAVYLAFFDPEDGEKSSRTKLNSVPLVLKRTMSGTESTQPREDN